ncbi:hypothetical protein ADUPG1_006809 [Aduncisulcus paluster]|uniref:Uncharacterized protein n=1 Tax=Aduncisulcus paluster TaxID=2918883 RepID=A0ABQ5KMI3_9EUKA|nr:hypothetical protein ADUPG1_006809 [Aduncisulcus paluster]
MFSVNAWLSHEILAHEGNINATSIGQATASIFATAGEDKIVKVFKLTGTNSAKPIYTLHNFPAQITCLEFNNDESQLAVGLQDGGLCLFDLKPPSPPCTSFPSDIAHPVSCISFSKDDSYLVVGTRNGMIKIYSKFKSEVSESSTHHPQLQQLLLPAHIGHTITHIIFTPHGTTFISGDDHGKGVFFSIRRSKEIQTLIHTAPTLSMAISPLEQLMALCSGSKAIRLWSLQSDLQSPGRSQRSKGNGFRHSLFLSKMYGAPLLAIDDKGACVFRYYTHIDHEECSKLGHCVSTDEVVCGCEQEIGWDSCPDSIASLSLPKPSVSAPGEPECPDATDVDKKDKPRGLNQQCVCVCISGGRACVWVLTISVREKKGEDVAKEDVTVSKLITKETDKTTLQGVSKLAKGIRAMQPPSDDDIHRERADTGDIIMDRSELKIEEEIKAREVELRALEKIETEVKEKNRIAKEKKIQEKKEKEKEEREKRERERKRILELEAERLQREKEQEEKEKERIARQSLRSIPTFIPVPDSVPSFSPAIVSSLLASSSSPVASSGFSTSPLRPSSSSSPTPLVSFTNALSLTRSCVSQWSKGGKHACVRTLCQHLCSIMDEEKGDVVDRVSCVCESLARMNRRSISLRDVSFICECIIRVLKIRPSEVFDGLDRSGLGHTQSIGLPDARVRQDALSHLASDRELDKATMNNIKELDGRMVDNAVSVFLARSQDRVMSLLCDILIKLGDYMMEKLRQGEGDDTYPSDADRYRRCKTAWNSCVEVWKYAQAACICKGAASYKKLSDLMKKMEL